MRKRLLVTLVALASATVVLVAPPVASAGDTICIGAITGTHDNVLVPPGMFCNINSAQVKGNVKALENSRLFMDSTTVGGSVEGDKAFLVHITDTASPGVSRVGGNIQAKEGVSLQICGTTLPAGNIQVEKFRPSANEVSAFVLLGGPTFCGAFFGGGNTLLKGNVKVEENALGVDGRLVIEENRIAQNLQVFKNTGGFAKTVQNNTVGQIIQCKENSPPFVGGPNTTPKKEDQCF